ncbi:MAG: beta-lactamase family protein [Planctomycetaceae bacterium]|nr:beta-lactamase family protein [Planctomycetaceae bacterium]
MKRRTFLQTGLALMLCDPRRSLAGLDTDKLETASKLLTRAAEMGEVESSSVYVQQGSDVFARTFGKAKNLDDMFLLASISKTISIAAVMTLYDEELFRLEDPIRKYIPEFQGEGRDKITLRQLMTHVSGLPDQLPENAKLRSQHAPLSEFVKAAIETPLLFEPGTRYSYSSMAILLATEVARRLSGETIHKLSQDRIFKPLGITRSAMGLGKFKLGDVIRNQVERAAPESGAGDPSTKSWDWNSEYWRKLGAPWGAAHGSAENVARFLAEFLDAQGKILKPETERLIVSNQNPENLRPRGLGFDLGQIGGTPGLSPNTFGHTGSTGTICWADPATKAITVILTTLPYRAVTPHPRDRIAALAAEAVQ